MALGFPEPIHQRNYQTGYYGLPAPFSGMDYSNAQGIYDPGEFNPNLVDPLYSGTPMPFDDPRLAGVPIPAIDSGMPIPYKEAITSPSIVDNPMWGGTPIPFDDPRLAGVPIFQEELYSNLPGGPTRANAGMDPYVPPEEYIPLSQPGTISHADPSYTSSAALGPQNSPGNKPWEASDAEMMVGMTASNIIPTRDQPRIMSGDRGGSAGGVAKGAIQGAMIGSKFGAPWWGAAIGATAGLLGFMDTTTPPQIIPAQIKRGSRTAFPQLPQTSSYYPGLLNA